MSAATFDIGQDRTVSINTGTFLNPAVYNVFCWWKVPGAAFELGFIVIGSQGGSSNIFICNIPDWSSLTVGGYNAVDLLPCGKSPISFAGTDATCNLDGSLTVKFGVAFSETNDVASLTEKHFALTKTFTFYATPKFLDFLPKMGQQTGGTEVNIYGANFLDLPMLQCRFSDGTQATTVDATYKSSNLITCESPVIKQQTEVAFYLTFNNVHWMQCSLSNPCTFFHPYYKEERTCCSWTDSISRVTTAVRTFSYAKLPSVTALNPTACPTQGDTNIIVLATNMVAGIRGTIFTCQIGGEIVYGQWKSDGGLSYMTCLTRPGMKKGKLEVRVSMNEFEFSKNFQQLDVFEPIHTYKVSPSFMIWDDPPSTLLTIIGRNFIKDDRGIGNIMVSFMEPDVNGYVWWEKTNPPQGYGYRMPDVKEPSLGELSAPAFSARFQRLRFSARFQRPLCLFHRACVSASDNFHMLCRRSELGHDRHNHRDPFSVQACRVPIVRAALLRGGHRLRLREPKRRQ